MGYVSIPTDLTSYSKTNEGTYTGNATNNRAIPHGLSKIPKLIVLRLQNGAASAFMTITSNGHIMGVNASATTMQVCTAIDNTNFYVGGAAGVWSNESTDTYTWVAIS